MTEPVDPWDQVEPDPPAAPKPRLVAADESPPQPRLMLNKNGRPFKTVVNLIDMLSEHEVWRDVVVWDDFAQTICKVKLPPIISRDDKPALGEWLDADTTRAQAWLQAQPTFHRMDPPARMVEDALLVVAERRTVHPIRDWLRSLDWDGTQRLPLLFPEFFGAQDTPLNREIGKRWMIAAVARVMNPGCQCKYMPVLESEQDAGKSTGIAALVNGPEQAWFSDTALRIGDKDSYQCLRSKWVHEWAELAAFRSARDVESLKSFISSQSDNFRASYGRRNRDWPRQCIFIGTTNEERWLTDPTGGSRFWPVRCRSGVPVDVTRIAELRPQLWAEAFTRFECGERYWLDPKQEADLLAHARAEQKARIETDPWISLVTEWLKSPTVPSIEHDGTRHAIDVSQGVTSTDLLIAACHVRPGDATRAHATRLGYVMREIGWQRFRQRLENVREYRYYPPGSTPPGQADFSAT